MSGSLVAYPSKSPLIEAIRPILRNDNIDTRRDIKNRIATIAGIL
jgi:hypothetical protein